MTKQILKNYWDGKLPVDVETIANKLNFKVIVYDSAEYIGSVHLGTEYGNLITHGSSISVVVKRFMIAHQIGHFALNHLNKRKNTLTEIPSNFSTKVKCNREIAANIFALEMLMPENVLKYAINKKGITRVQDLSRVFLVSEVAVKKRLVDLGII